MIIISFINDCKVTLKFFLMAQALELVPCMCIQKASIIMSVVLVSIYLFYITVPIAIRGLHGHGIWFHAM